MLIKMNNAHVSVIVAVIAKIDLNPGGKNQERHNDDINALLISADEPHAMSFTAAGTLDDEENTVAGFLSSSVPQTRC